MAIIPKTHLWQNRVPTTTCWLGEVKAFVSFWECLLLNRTNTWTVKSSIDWLSCVDAEWKFPEEMFAHQLTSNTFPRLPSDQPHERRLRRACTMWHLGIDMEICVNWVLFLLVEISSPIVERLSTISLSRFAPFERRKKYKVILSFVFFFLHYWHWILSGSIFGKCFVLSPPTLIRAILWRMWKHLWLNFIIFST